MPTSREKRIARNEVAFRAFNEELIATRGLQERAPEELIGVVCECGDQACEAFVRVPIEAYRRARADDRSFVIVRGHDIPEVEDVIEETERHAVVHKHAAVGDVVDR